MEKVRKFETGKVVATRGVLSVFGIYDLLLLLERHVSGDWGDLDYHDRAANEAALKNGTRLLSSYEMDEGKVWIITEADRSSTTFLLPGEY